MKKIISLFSLTVICSLFTVHCFAAAKAKKKTPVPAPTAFAIVGYIVDGDTFSAKVLLKDDIEISVRVRFLDIDAPELAGECDSEIIAANASRDRLAELIPVGSMVTLSRIKDDKYLGRIDAAVTNDKGMDVGPIMISEGHARPYSGGKRNPWCE